MEFRDRSKNSPSGNEGHVCNKCGWVFPNAHPSARHRRAHKKVCGTIQINDSKTLIINGSETMEKIEEMIISGFGSGSYRSIRSEEDVFSDAVAEFADNSSVVSDSNGVIHSTLDDIDIHTCSVSTMKDVNDESEHDNNGYEKVLQVVDEVNTHNHTVCVHGDGDGAQMEKNEASNVEELENDGDEVNVDEYDGRKSASSVVADCISSVEDEVSTHNHTICVHNNKASDPADGSLSEKFNGNGDQLENTETSNVEELENDGDDGVNTRDHIICMHKDSDSVYDILSEKVNDNGAQMEKTEEINVEEIEYFSVEDEVNTHYHTISVVKASDTVDESLSKEKNEGSKVEELESASVEDEVNPQNDIICVNNNKDSVSVNSRSAKMDGNGDEMEEKETSNVEELECASSVVINSISSVEDEGNTQNHTILGDNGDQLEKTEEVIVEELDNNGDKVPGEECFGKVDIGLISDNDDINDLNQDSEFSQTDSVECNRGSISDAPGAVETGKSVEENTSKQHMLLKSYLGESSPSTSSTKETINTVMSNEWNSPARYPSKIKAEKGKVRRPYWAPFICCSSVQTS